MPSKPTPTVQALILDKIDTLGLSLTKHIELVRTDLGERITALDYTVKAQNGRIGKVEAAHSQCQAERRQERVEVRQLVHMTKGRAAALLGGGGVVGATVLEVIKHWLGQ